MIELPEETVLHVASLARIGLSSDEIKMLQRDLASILLLFKELEAYSGESDIDPILETLSVPRTARQDFALPTTVDAREAIIKNFPTEKDNYLKVRSVFSL